MSEAEDSLAALSGGRRPPWSAFRAELERRGFRPSKTLGQNFLIDPNAARSIAEDAGLAPGARVLEIGAGCGFLSMHLAALGLDLLAVEIDERLLEVARRLVAGLESAGPGCGRVRWLCTDALAGKHALDARLAAELPREGTWHVVSNLPYSISAPLLVLMARLPNPPESLTVLVQDEVARRVAAEPGQPEWGSLTARLRLSYVARLGRTVGAQLFWPRPRVGSRVVHLARAPGEPPGASDLAAYDALVDALFQHRRKQLAASLVEPMGDRGRALALLGEAGLDPRSRAEVLAPEELLRLARSPLWPRRGSRTPD